MIIRSAPGRGGEVSLRTRVTGAGEGTVETTDLKKWAGMRVRS